MNIINVECINRLENTVTLTLTSDQLYSNTYIEIAEYNDDNVLVDWIPLATQNDTVQTFDYTITNPSTNFLRLRLLDQECSVVPNPNLCGDLPLIFIIPSPNGSPLQAVGILSNYQTTDTEVIFAQTDYNIWETSIEYTCSTNPLSKLVFVQSVMCSNNQLIDNGGFITINTDPSISVSTTMHGLGPIIRIGNLLYTNIFYQFINVSDPNYGAFVAAIGDCACIDTFENPCNTAPEDLPQVQIGNLANIINIHNPPPPIQPPVPIFEANNIFLCVKERGPQCPPIPLWDRRNWNDIISPKYLKILHIAADRWEKFIKIPQNTIDIIKGFDPDWCGIRINAFELKNNSDELWLAQMGGGTGLLIGDVKTISISAGKLEINDAHSGDYSTSKWIDILAHELGHSLGLVTLRRSNDFFINNTEFPLAVDAYSSIIQKVVPLAPLEKCCGSGTRSSHWLQRFITVYNGGIQYKGFIDEIMCSLTFTDVPAKISLLSIKYLVDNGYLEVTPGSNEGTPLTWDQINQPPQPPVIEQPVLDPCDRFCISFNDYNPVTHQVLHIYNNLFDCQNTCFCNPPPPPPPPPPPVTLTVTPSSSPYPTPPPPTPPLPTPTPT